MDNAIHSLNLESHHRMQRSIDDAKLSSLYEKISSKVGKDVEINRSLCLYSPREVHHAILHNTTITKWLQFISNEYEFPEKKILLIYPCSTTKPYDKSQSYRQLYKTLAKLQKKSELIHLLTISEPFGLVPMEFYTDSFSWYDCPGLFEWWCKKHGTLYEDEFLDKSISLLADYVGKTLKRAIREYDYEHVVGFVRTYTSKLETRKDHTHRRILGEAALRFDIPIKILPDAKTVHAIAKERGHFAWDMYGPGHPVAQDSLFSYLRKIA